MSIYVVIREKTTVFVSAERWFDVQKWARVRFADDYRDTKLSKNQKVALVDFELRWVGHDAGPYQNRRMEVRADSGEWEAA